MEGGCGVNVEGGEKMKSLVFKIIIFVDMDDGVFSFCGVNADAE